MKTLVIIDDEVFFRKSLINFLEKQNIYKIVGEANNGQAGIKLIENIKPDIALVDISMPIMSGLDMIETFGADCHTKFILSTGYEDFEYAKKSDFPSSPWVSSETSGSPGAYGNSSESKRRVRPRKFQKQLCE